MTEQLIGQLASTGVVGVLLGLAILALRDKDKQLRTEMEARIADAAKFNTLAMSLQREVIEAVNKLGDMLTIMERRDEAKAEARAEAKVTGPFRPPSR